MRHSESKTQRRETSSTRPAMRRQADLCPSECLAEVIMDRRWNGVGPRGSGDHEEESNQIEVDLQKWSATENVVIIEGPNPVIRHPFKARNLPALWASQQTLPSKDQVYSPACIPTHSTRPTSVTAPRKEFVQCEGRPGTMRKRKSGMHHPMSLPWLITRRLGAITWQNLPGHSSKPRLNTQRLE